MAAERGDRCGHPRVDRPVFLDELFRRAMEVEIRHYPQQEIIGVYGRAVRFLRQ